jgi:flagellin-like protein
MMKKMWKMRKDKSAVSPVIATILMVAITVVLAAVLYVMVMGFGSTPNNNPTGAIGPANKIAANSYTISVVSISSNNVLINDCKFNMMINSTAGTAITLSYGTAVSMTTFGTPTRVYTVTYNDIDGNLKVSAGDTISINSGVIDTNNFLHSTTYVAKLLGTGAQIAETTFINA